MVVHLSPVTLDVGGATMPDTPSEFAGNHCQGQDPKRLAIGLETSVIIRGGGF